MTSDTILRLLRAKHSEDIFVAECKDGPTQSVRNHSKLDAWVMPRSWSHPHLTGYEIKVSRSDFLGDEKWRNYLGMCNYLYFATPPGLIDKNELPPEIGLLETSTAGARLFIKRKAQYRAIEEPSSLFRYVLMCRSRVGSELTETTDRRAFWKLWMEEQKIDTMFGHNVSRSIAKRLQEEITLVGLENHRLKKQCEGYAEIKIILAKLGLPENCDSWSFENRLTRLREGLTNHEMHALESVCDLLPKFLKKLKGDK